PRPDAFLHEQGRQQGVRAHLRRADRKVTDDSLGSGNLAPRCGAERILRKEKPWRPLRAWRRTWLFQHMRLFQDRLLTPFRILRATTTRHLARSWRHPIQNLGANACPICMHSTYSITDSIGRHMRYGKACGTLAA